MGDFSHGGTGDTERGGEAGFDTNWIIKAFAAGLMPYTFELRCSVIFCLTRIFRKKSIVDMLNC